MAEFNVSFIIFGLFCLARAYGTQMSPNEICKLPMEAGPCRQYLLKFYFNEQSGKCEQFTYGGCRGNGNNFDSLEACRAICIDKPPRDEMAIDHCLMPKDKGPCMAYIPRFHYNMDSGECEQFIYGGCLGNRNNFETVDECDKVCVKAQIKDQSRKPSGPAILPVPDKCSLPKDGGPCHAYFPKFYFNKYTGQCEQFIYGGCRGNENNFMSKQDCERACAKPASNYADEQANTAAARGSIQYRCILSKDQGPCAAYIRRFHYNKNTGKCENFIYGGCRGNENNFMTMDECESACVQTAEPQPPIPFPLPAHDPSMPRQCSQPQETGPCMAYLPRFHFNVVSQKCEQFIYGGCLGNKNNFMTMEKCQATCQPRTEIPVDIRTDDSCELPESPFICLGYFRRYHYEKSTGQCKQMIYGGCGGQEGVNIFTTQSDCENKCVQKH